MILAEKITQLRKMNGMSQEELAEKLGVSRQSISKWESAQSVPDLKRILSMAELFGVSTDVLLREDQVLEERIPSVSPDGERQALPGECAAELPPLRQVSMEEANTYLKRKTVFAGRIAIGVMLCILSPVVLMLIAGAQATGRIAISENQAAGFGVLILMLMIGCAVGLFVYYGMKMQPCEYIEKEPIETEYGVSGMVRERLAKYTGTHTRYMLTGILLCVLSCIPIFIALMISDDSFVMIIAVSALLVLVAIGVMLIVRTNIIADAMRALLEEGEFSRENKRNTGRNDAVMSIYWAAATVVYLLLSFLTRRWDMTWIVWPVAGVGCALLAAILRVTGDRE